MTYTVFADGGSRGNPGIAGIGVVIYEDTQLVASLSEAIGKNTNNFAEYTALFEGLKKLATLSAENERVVVKMDSELVVKQMRGEYKVKHPNIKPLFEKSKILADQFKHITFEHIPRAKNAEADALANEAMDSAR